MGDELPRWHLDRVDPERMKVLALLLADPNPLHYDLEAARRAGFAERVNQGPSTMAMLVNMLHAAFPGGRLRKLRVQLRGSVVAGSAVRAGGRIVGHEPAEGGRTVVCEVHLETGAGERVLTGRAEVHLPAEPPPSATEPAARSGDE